MRYKRIKGTQDIYGTNLNYWNEIVNTSRKILRIYGFNEIITPIIEPTEIFSRSVGEETDIVQKEMYTFLDKGGRSITLRPEGTASVVRAYIENSMINLSSPLKLFYIGPMFRYEKPQAGRLRQFHHIGVELFGSDNPIADAEIILLAHELLSNLGLKNFRININSIGCEKDRPKYREVLRNYYKPYLNELCDDCKRRYNTNILRLLDCKVDVEYAKNAPSILDFLCEECKEHFNQVINYLDAMGVKYHINPRIVRGLDYYTRTIFEIEHGSLGAQNVILAGGRYDKLVNQLGGPDVPAIGFAMGIERVILAMKEENIEIDDLMNVDVYVAFEGEKTDIEAINISKELRKKGIRTFMNLSKRNFKNQLKHANKIGAKFVIIIGENELENDVFTVKNMESGEQYTVEKEWVVNFVEDKLMKME